MVLLYRERENESSDDEEHFQRKEAGRLERDRAKLRPVILGGPAQAADSAISTDHTFFFSCAFADCLLCWDCF